ncbi:DUF779 domain-containing protein [uncultured Microbacterium sp.]|uniref:DUF779 domain-containing protein n=1 Tax=uncultured Microbacterium sp. TaxID=191216 RepID=UPI0025F786D8|nr:DUF779 domain-containing protein [uncultured Microbacterium sp.]
MVTQTQSQAASRAFSRVGVTDAAAALLRQLTEQYGPLMFHQSGGCCDGSAPMCYPVGMFITGPSDVHLGTLEVGLPAPIEVFISEAQFEYWKYTHITIDVVPGRGSGFSVEGPTGNRFIIRSRMLTNDECAHFGLRNS